MQESYELYKSDTCGFCHRVMRFLQGTDLEVALKDIYRDEGAMRELVQGGGRSTVPCLRIERADAEVQWMYESLDIIAYLDRVQNNHTS